MVFMTYDATGNLLTTSDLYGHAASQTMASANNYAVPSSMTAGSLSTSFTWNGGNQMTVSTGPNSATLLSSYDSYLRPMSRTAPNGSVTTFPYNAMTTVAKTGTRYTMTTVDGFGRTKFVESGYLSGVTQVPVSTVATEYTPCACSPMGKVWRTSLPYGPGGTPGWTEYVSDALGRTVQVKLPQNGAAVWGTTSYVYEGATAKVTEPKPGGGTYVSDYTYSELGKLLTTTMTRPAKGIGNGTNVTQTRTWVYDGTTQRLTSMTTPETGTYVSGVPVNGTTSFTYNPDGSLYEKLDPKGQKIRHARDGDGRVTSTRRFWSGGSEDTCGRVDYFYSSQTFDLAFSTNATGRLAATATGCPGTGTGPGQVIELYAYNAAGAVTKKRLRLVRLTETVDKDVTYSYGSDGKLSTVLYPGATIPYTYTYDAMDRPDKMTGPSTMLGTQTVDHAKDIEYGVAGQMTKIKYLQGELDDSAMGDGSHWAQVYFSELKSYNELFQMIEQTTTGYGVPTAARIGYAYSPDHNNGRIMSRKNFERNGATGETVTYAYDDLNRVTSASSNVGWTQSFDFDGFGNLWSQTMAGGSATPMSVNFNIAKNRIDSSGWSFDLNGNTTVMPTAGGSATMTYDIDNRMATLGSEEYAYLSDNKRVWKKSPAGVETVYFYGVGGQKLITYTVQASPFALTSPSMNVYFGGKLIRADGAAVVHDRLGSVVARTTCTVVKHDYLPYGEEMGTPTSGNVDKFGTYSRDQTSGLDYADQRYFAGTLGGRFLTADPYEASGGAAEPGSWGRYAYVGGDPVNWHDPFGLQAVPPEDGTGGGPGNGDYQKSEFEKVVGVPNGFLANVYGKSTLLWFADGFFNDVSKDCSDMLDALGITTNDFEREARRTDLISADLNPSQNNGSVQTAKAGFYGESPRPLIWVDERVFANDKYRPTGLPVRFDFSILNIRISGTPSVDAKATIAHELVHIIGQGDLSDTAVGNLLEKKYPGFKEKYKFSSSNTNGITEMFKEKCF